MLGIYLKISVNLRLDDKFNVKRVISVKMNIILDRNYKNLKLN